MATLADLFESSGGAPGGAARSERDDYLAYQEACIMAGVTPLKPAEWVKAGRPKGP